MSVQVRNKGAKYWVWNKKKNGYSYLEEVWTQECLPVPSLAWGIHCGYQCQEEITGVFERGSRYIYKQDSEEKEKKGQSTTQQCRALRCLEEVLWRAIAYQRVRWSTKATPPVRTSFDRFVDNWDRDIHSYTTVNSATFQFRLHKIMADRAARARRSWWCC